MRYLFPTLLLIAVVLSLASSCEPDIIEPPIPPPPPLSCSNGYEPNDTEDSCICPGLKVELFGVECYDIPPGAFYSDMEGCYFQSGMICEVEYDTSRLIDDSGIYRLGCRVASLNPNVDVYQSFPVNSFLYERNNGQLDSIRIMIEDPFTYSAFQHPDLLGVAATEFRGIWSSADTIEGYFIFGYIDHGSPVIWDMIELERCPATLIRY